MGILSIIYCKIHEIYTVYDSNNEMPVICCVHTCTVYICHLQVNINDYVIYEQPLIKQLLQINLRLIMICFVF